VPWRKSSPSFPGPRFPDVVAHFYFCLAVHAFLSASLLSIPENVLSWSLHIFRQIAPLTSSQDTFFKIQIRLILFPRRFGDYNDKSGAKAVKVLNLQELPFSFAPSRMPSFMF